MLRRLFGAGPSTPSVSVGEAHSRQQQGALVVDVRETHEWKAGHVPGARHIPLGQLSRSLASLPANRDLLVICHSGNRSSLAVGVLQQAGYSRATNVAGGMSAWTRAGLTVTR